MTKIVDCSFRLPDKGLVADLHRLVKQVLDTYMKEVPPAATYELIAFPDVGLLRFRSPGRLPRGIVDRKFDPTLRLTETYCPEVAGFLIEKGTNNG